MEVFFLLVLVLLMVAALGSGFPVAFALPGSAIISIGLAALTGYLFTGNPDAFFYQGSAVNWLTAGVTNFRGIYWEAERDTLIAIPLFVFMGIMLQRSRIAEDLLIKMAQLFGPVRGGLGMSVVFVGALLAATTGIVGATVVAMGLISLPAMLRNNYSHPLATGTIAASGTLGQIIPPSIVLIILADQLASATDQASTARKALYQENTGELVMPSHFDVTSTSAGEMFLGAFIPGLALVVLYMLYIGVFAFLRPKAAPTVPYEGKYNAQFFGGVALALIPPLALIFAVLGSIIMGVATVNQAGAIGACGALIMAGYRLKLGQPRAYWPAILAGISVTIIMSVARFNPVNVRNIVTEADTLALYFAIAGVAGLVISLIWSAWRAYKVENALQGVMIETAKTTSLVFIILLGAAMLTSAFRGFGGEELVKEFLGGLPGGFWGQFFVVMAVIFLLGFFLDFIEIAVVVVPIVAPILLMDPNANVTAVWLGVMIGLNIQTSFLTPPFGFALFYLRGVAPAIVKTVSMYKGVIPFILLQLLALVIVAYNPPMVNYLPQRISLTSPTAPPPVNPRLQLCIESSLAGKYRAEEQMLRAAINSARTLDLSDMPENLRNNLTQSFDDAEKTFELMEAILSSEQAVNARDPEYRPLHIEVRDIQRQIQLRETRISAIATSLRRPDTLLFAEETLVAERDALRSQIEALRGTIPDRWEQEHKDFRALQQLENRARLAYRRNVDGAYTPVRDALGLLQGTDALGELRPDITALRAFVADNPLEDGANQVAALLEGVRAVDGTQSIQSPLTDARRALTGRTTNRDDALAAISRAVTAYEQEMSWRSAAAQKALSGLSGYEEAIRPTIGLRQQRRIPEDFAIGLAGCLAEHEDLTLHF
ncbi:MAG: TRAP transporter large permease subunit [Rhodomicrobiaceae bacterium]